jgi:rRNA maturation RNase YbeY
VIDIRTLHRTRRYPRHAALRLLETAALGERAQLGAVDLIFVDDRTMRELNRRYLRHDWTTDVLSFSYGTRRRLEGEIIVNLDQARRQAPTFGATYRQEVSRLIVHGLLHLAGHDDRTDAERERMHRREDRYLHHFQRND